MDIQQLDAIRMELTRLISIVNDFDIDNDMQDEQIDKAHRHLMKAHSYLTYLRLEVDI